MAALSEEALAAQAEEMGMEGLPWDVVRRVVGRLVWGWVAEHESDTVVQLPLKVLFLRLRVTVKVRDCEWLVRALFGPPPPIVA